MIGLRKSQQDYVELLIEQTTSASGINGGVISNSGTLIISNSSFSDNTISTTYGYSGGGAIYNSGSLTMFDSGFTGNWIDAVLDGYGGAIYNDGVLAITNSTFTDNSIVKRTNLNNVKADGGAIYNTGSVAISQSVFTGNHAVGVSESNGGGVYNGDNAQLSIEDSTFSDNWATGVGINGNGGSVYNNGQATITSSTFFSNEAYNGGGIFNGTAGNLTLKNDTFDKNITASGLGGAIKNINILTIINSTIYGSFGGGIGNYGILNYTNTLIANSDVNPDCFNVNGGTIETNIKNFVGDGSCSASMSGNPNLGPLADNGGPTKTMMLLHDSLAIDAGDDENCPITDQRGVSRPQGVRCDIGAFEILDITISGNVGVKDALVNYAGGSTAVSDNGDYFFVVPQGWSGTVMPSKSGYTFLPESKIYDNVTSDQPNENYIATQNEYTLSITSAHGAIAKTPDQATYHEGDVVQITAIPYNGWFFVNWTEGLAGAANPSLITINGNTSVTANYNKIQAYYSTALNDGWTLESKETSNVAGRRSNIGSLLVGDNALKRQYRSILYFDTASLPDKAVITKATLLLKQESVVGTPFATLGSLVAEIKKGYFGLAPLEVGDFNATGVPIRSASGFVVTGSAYQLEISSPYFRYINLIGATQFRLRFTRDDDNDKIADFISFFSGEAFNEADRPQLLIEYYVP